MIYFEDMIAGEFMTSPAVVVDRDEMVDFARRWDPLPIHVDDEVAADYGGLTAPGPFVLAVKQHLIHQLPLHAVIASFGYDEVRFHQPRRPGDEVHLRYEFVENHECIIEARRSSGWWALTVPELVDTCRGPRSAGTFNPQLRLNRRHEQSHLR